MNLTVFTMRSSTRRALLFASLSVCLLALLAPMALAQSECVKNFRISGDPRNGATYLSYVTIPNLDAHSALGQVEAIGLAAGLKVGAENYEGDSGTLVLYRKDESSFLHQNKGFPIMFKADKPTNRLIMAFQLNQGQTAPADKMQDFTCSILNNVHMNSAGAAAAAAAHAETHSDEITNITANELAQKLTARFWHRFKASNEVDQYMGRVYRIDGQVSIPMNLGAELARTQSVQNGSKSFDFMFYTPKAKTGLIGTPIGAQIGTITCHTDPSQLNRFLALRDQDYVTLIGKVVQVNPGTYAVGLYLDCRFEK